MRTTFYGYSDNLYVDNIAAYRFVLILNSVNDIFLWQGGYNDIRGWIAPFVNF